MNEVQVFNFENRQVRTLLINSKPYFAGRDVTKILGYSRPSNAIAMHVNEDDALKWGLTDSIGRKQKSLFVNESGLYSLILSSKLKTAKKFKRWVTSEVLPSIRKQGSYLTNEKAYDITHNKNALADMLIQAGEQLKEAHKQITDMKPKALFADAVTSSDSTVLIGELAKILKGNGVDIGQQRLFEWLRKNNYLVSRHGSEHNMPTQRAMDLGLFKIDEHVIKHTNGKSFVYKTPKVTGKGQKYFIAKFINKKNS